MSNALKPKKYKGKLSENTYNVNRGLGLRAYNRSLGLGSQHSKSWSAEMDDILKEICKYDKNATSNGRSIKELIEILEFIKACPSEKRTMVKWDAVQSEKRKNDNISISNIILRFNK